jgi:hypothetical protein
MNRFRPAFALLLILGFSVDSISQTAGSGNTTIHGIFIGSTPCGQNSKPLQGIPATADCEFIKWELTLSYDQSKTSPTIYNLTYWYGMAKAGTTGFIDGGKKVETTGKWTIIKGTKTNPRAIIYQLDPDKPASSISFLKLSDKVLHLLDTDGRLMVGNAGFSYTLNKK